MAKMSGKKNVSKKTVEIKARPATGRTKAISVKQAPPKSSRAQPAAKQSAKAPRQVATAGRIELTCSDCSSDFLLDVARAKQQETLTCPACEHRAQSPSNDILHQIALWKGLERKNLVLSVGAAVIGALAMLAWPVLTSMQALAQDPLVFYGPIALAVVMALIALVFGAKHERSRHVAFF